MKLSVNNDLYKMNLVNIRNYFNSREVQKQVAQGLHGNVFGYIESMAVAWAMDSNQVMNDYLIVVKAMKDMEC